MKTALVVPGTRESLENARFRELYPQLLPMSAAYLASMLEREGFESLIIDQIPAGYSNAALVARLVREAPSLIGFSLLTTTVPNVTEMVELVRRELAGVPIVMGNHHASLFADEILRSGLADLVVRGEGEITLVELVRALAEGAPLEDIAGLSFKKGEQVHHNPARPMIADLDSLPAPAWGKVDVFNRAYMELPIIGVYSTPVSIMASRGCPFSCVFCSQDAAYKKVRLRKITRVVDEIEECVDRYGFEWLSFNDAYFPWTKKQGMEFADEMIRRGLHKRVRWITESRVDRVDEELILRLKESGLSVIFFGFESGNQRVLDMARKETTLEQARAAARAVRKAGITLMGFFMLGLPGDTVESCWETVNFAMELDCDFAKFAITVPYPGSQLYEEQKARLGGGSFEKYTSWYNWASGDEDVAFAPDGMSARELLTIQRLGMLKFYARPAQVVRHLRRGTLTPGYMAFGARVLAGGAMRETAARMRERLKPGRGA